jgi:hypothetical protein
MSGFTAVLKSSRDSCSGGADGAVLALKVGARRSALLVIEGPPDFDGGGSGAGA